MMWLNALKSYTRSETEIVEKKEPEKNVLREFVEKIDSGKMISHGFVRLWAPTSRENGKYHHVIHWG